MADNLTETILRTLVDSDGVDTLELATRLKVDHQKVVGAVKSIQAIGDVSGRMCTYILEPREYGAGAGLHHTQLMIACGMAAVYADNAVEVLHLTSLRRQYKPLVHDHLSTFMI